MFDFFKGNKRASSKEQHKDEGQHKGVNVEEQKGEELQVRVSKEENTMVEDPKKEKLPEKTNKGFFERLKEGLKKTRLNFTDGLSAVFGHHEIDQELLSELEDILLTMDVGVNASERIIKKLNEKLKRHELKDIEALKTTLKDTLYEILLPCERPLTIQNDKKPFVILMVGINGSGKTTTIGKMTKHLMEDNKTVLLAAGDTYRAAAAEQLKIWGERNNVPVISQQSGSDSASVIYDAIQSAIARKVDVLIADTAGRLHTQSNLMEELKKVNRVIAKCDPTAPHETLLVLDAGIGQNTLIQAQKFHEAIGVTGIVLTKLDGTAKGGIIFNVAESLKIPIRFIGVGEKLEDLRPFKAKEFVEALF